MIGHPIHQDAALVLTSLGGDTSNFAARQLTPKVASSAELVLTMTKEHRDSVLEIAPRLLRRTYTLAEAAILGAECDAETIDDLAALRPQLAGRDVPDILDPIGQNAEVFAWVGGQIAELLPPILELFWRSSAAAAQ